MSPAVTEAERRLLTALAGMCSQYLETEDGDLDHLFMSAGEGAVRILVDYGLVTPSGRGGTWTDDGQALLKD